jgi:hypothetical protein
MIKNFLKDKFLIAKIRNRFNPAVQISQRQLFHTYQDLLSRGNLPKLSDAGFKVFSQFEEDGLLLFIFSVLGMTNKTFVEIGSDDGVNSNSANLYFNFGWHGLFIDGNKSSIKRGVKFFAKYPHSWNYKPKFICAKVNRENINELIESAGYQGEIGLLSIDIDSYDYQVWKSLKHYRPKIVIIEINSGVHPKDETYIHDGVKYQGTGFRPTYNLGIEKGYKFVLHTGNMFFVRDDLFDKLDINYSNELENFITRWCRNIKI